MRLPGYVELRLKSLGVHIERYGRGGRGARMMSGRRWYFCGWYWYRGTKSAVEEGPEGPYTSWSAAAADALKYAEARQWRPDLRMLKPEERDTIRRASV